MVQLANVHQVEVGFEEGPPPDAPSPHPLTYLGLAAQKPLVRLGLLRLDSELTGKNQQRCRLRKFRFTMSAVGPEGSAAAAGNKRLQQTQAQVDEVVDIMRVNVDKVLERDQKLSELDDRADALQAGASQFETSAAKLKRKYWWKNCKMWAILIAVIVIIIVIIIIWNYS
ncbi:hypothetical protein ACER0C_019096 [Sarotherodon galilaeus]